MFAQRGKTRYDEGKTKDKKQNPRRNLDQITWNECEEKGHYAGNNECYKQKNSNRTQKNLEKQSKKNLGTSPLMEENKKIGKCLRCIIQSHDGNFHLGMGWPTIYWAHVFQTSSQGVLQTEPITDETKEKF